MHLLSPSPSALVQTIAILRSGGIVVHATETCYGIACDMTNPIAIGRLFAIKKRPSSQPVSALFSSVDQAKQYVEFSNRALQLANQYLPGPLTLILPLQFNLPTPLFITPSNHQTRKPANQKLTLGVRISSHPVAMSIATAFDKPISTTSANIHGMPEAYSIEELLEQFDDGELPDVIINSGELAKAAPSTIVEVVGDTMNVIRQGGIHI